MNRQTARFSPGRLPFRGHRFGLLVASQRRGFLLSGCLRRRLHILAGRLNWCLQRIAARRERRCRGVQPADATRAGVCSSASMDGTVSFLTPILVLVKQADAELRSEFERSRTRTLHEDRCLVSGKTILASSQHETMDKKTYCQPEIGRMARLRSTGAIRFVARGSSRFRRRPWRGMLWHGVPVTALPAAAQALQRLSTPHVVAVFAA